ncbi:MAG: hypothetical protein MJ237_07285 [bacterium]|nr:hypothetical protein [bacterium]
MKILPITKNIYNNHNSVQNSSVQNQYLTQYGITAPQERQSDTVSFCARTISPKLMFDKKAHLANTIDKYLRSQPKGGSLDERLAIYLKNYVAFILNKQRRRNELRAMFEAIKESNVSMNLKKRQVKELYKRYTIIQNEKFKPFDYDEEIDEMLSFSLLYKFKSAQQNGNYNFDRIFKEHYKDLKNITTIEQLSKKYPEIQLPESPIDVISAKMETSITREVYETITEYKCNKQVEKIDEYVGDYIRGLLLDYAAQTTLDFNFLWNAFAERITEYMAEKYVEIERGSVSLNSIPQSQNKLAKITEDDFAILSIWHTGHYDKYILDVIKQHYLEGKNLKDISTLITIPAENLTIGKDQNVSFDIKSIEDKSYKFTPISNKIKKIIEMAKAIKGLESQYDNYDVDMFKEKLSTIANLDISQNDTIYESIMEFELCNFEKDDLNELKKLFKLVDLYNDGEINEKTIAEKIEKEHIYPVGTRKINALRKQQEIRIDKERQVKHKEYLEFVRKFDNAINTLYVNGLNTIANDFWGYRPQGIADIGEEAKFIIDVIERNVNSDNELADSAKMRDYLIHWNSYTNYKKNNVNSELIKEAEMFASSKTGEIDKDKAGQYIIYSEILQSYPESSELFHTPKVLEIIDNSILSPSEKVQMMMKYDKYHVLNDKEKSFLSSIYEIFDVKKPIEKDIISYILNTDYVNNDTVIDLPENKITAAICATGKQQIMDEHKFPQSFYVLKDFEDALRLGFTGQFGVSGIKQCGNNDNTLQHKHELKVVGVESRMFSSKNDYRFDIYEKKSSLH